MKIGFTGTRKGMTPYQMGCVRFLLEIFWPNEVHHGGCQGADLEFHDLSFGSMRHVHPGPKSSQCRGWLIKEYPIRAHLKRNQDIVDTCDLLIACPKEKREILRSGTWATIRYARKVGKPTIILLP